MSMRFGRVFSNSLRSAVRAISVGAIAASLWLGFANSTPALETEKGSEIFKANCAACHANGGNIVRWGKNLKQRALRRNKVDNLAAVVSLVTYGKNNMPAYSDRLSEAQIDTVSAYVLQRAAENWR